MNTSSCGAMASGQWQRARPSGEHQARWQIFTLKQGQKKFRDSTRFCWFSRRIPRIRSQYGETTGNDCGLTPVAFNVEHPHGLRRDLTAVGIPFDTPRNDHPMDQPT